MIPSPPPRPLLSVRRLRVYRERGGLLSRTRTAKAIDDVHFDLRAGETLAIVGESGSGKSTLTAALAGVLPATAGSISFAGRERVRMPMRELRSLDAEIRAVDQVPLAVFGKRARVERLLGSALGDVVPRLDATTRRSRIAELLVQVGLTAEIARQRLGELSPAEQARVMLARALVVTPQLLICDGPAAGVDADSRTAMLDLVMELQRERGFALILMAQSFEELAGHAARVMVLSLGRIMEQGPMRTVMESPAHPYSRRLLALARGPAEEALTEEGEPLSARETPTAENPPMGCVFHTRCSLAERSCVQSVPLLKRTLGSEHYAACHFAPVPS